MTAKKKPGGVALTWQRQVVDDSLADDELSDVDRRRIQLLAMHLSHYADADGGNVRPSQVTVARRSTIERRDVRSGLDWMERRDHLVQTRPATAGRVAWYRLRRLDPTNEPGAPAPQVDEYQPDASAPQVASQSHDQPGGQPGARPGAPAPHNLLDLPNVVREGGGGDPSDGPDRSTPLRVGPPTDGSTEEVVVEDRHFVEAFLAKHGKTYGDVHRSNNPASHEKLWPQVRRLRANGWTPKLVDYRLADLPRSPRSAAGIIAKRLSELPDEPDLDPDEIPLTATERREHEEAALRSVDDRRKTTSRAVREINTLANGGDADRARAVELLDELDRLTGHESEDEPPARRSWNYAGRRLDELELDTFARFVSALDPVETGTASSCPEEPNPARTHPLL